MKAPEEIADNALVLMADIFPTGEVLRLRSTSTILTNYKVTLQPITLSKR